MKRPPRHANSGTRSATRLRPRERVLRYLIAELEKPGSKAGTRLPTVRAVMARLGVCTSTVQAAFRQLRREGRIRSKVGNGTFLVSPVSREPSHLRLGLNLAATFLQTSASDHAWLQPIYMGVLQQALALHKGVEMVSLLPDSGQTTKQPPRTSGALDGVLIFPSYDPAADARWSAHFERRGCPVVSLNPLALSATSDFVSPNYFESGERIGQAFRRSGRRHILFLHHHPSALSVSDRMRLGGLLTGSSPGTVCESLCGYSMEAERSPLHERLKRVLSRASPKTDAIYCAGDWLAVETVSVLCEMDRRVPEAVSVVGGSGIKLDLTRCPNLTRTAQPLQQMGRELLSMLVRRIHAGGASVPGKILPTFFMGGATTLPSENAILGLGGKERASG